jgi:hypothetical protein
MARFPRSGDATIARKPPKLNFCAAQTTESRRLSSWPCRCLCRRPGPPRIILGYGRVGGFGSGCGSVERYPPAGRASRVVSDDGGAGNGNCATLAGATRIGSTCRPAQPEIVIAASKIGIADEQRIIGSF